MDNPDDDPRNFAHGGEDDLLPEPNEMPSLGPMLRAFHLSSVLVRKEYYIFAYSRPVSAIIRTSWTR
jgi:hypothetical protein